MNFDNFKNRNALLLDTNGEEFGELSLLEKVSSIVRGEADALLKKSDIEKGFYYSHINGKVERINEIEQVCKVIYDSGLESELTSEEKYDFIEYRTTKRYHEYSRINEKDKIISENKKEMLEEIKLKGKSIQKKDLLKQYFEYGYLEIEEIKLAIENYIKNKIDFFLNHYFLFIKLKKEKNNNLSFDVFLNEQSKILIYGYINGLIDNNQITKVLDFLEKSGYDLEYLIEQNKNFNIVEEYLDKILN